MSGTEPLVAVMTPVYNGGKYLEKCLESVRSQEYRNWIHIVVDNVSTDDTRRLAESFAARDSRFVVKVESEHVNMVQNWNRGLGYVPPEATYLKQLHADDFLRPHCLSTMVEAAESEPDASIVVSAFHVGTRLRPLDRLRERTRVPGRKAARSAMLARSNLLANPSVPMVRIASAAGWPHLFHEEEFPPGHAKSPPLCQADKEGYLGSLERGDLLFLPESLMVLRREGPSAEDWSRRVGAYQPGRLELLLRHGRRFFDDDELRSAIRSTIWKYGRAMAWRVAARRSLGDSDFMDFQRLCLQHLLPRLREEGYSGEATLLSRFANGLRRMSRDRTE